MNNLEYKKIGAKIYYLKDTGEIIYIIGQKFGIDVDKFDIDITDKIKNYDLNNIGIYQCKYNEIYDNIGNNNDYKIDVTQSPHKLIYFYNIQKEQKKIEDSIDPNILKKIKEVKEDIMIDVIKMIASIPNEKIDINDIPLNNE